MSTITVRDIDARDKLWLQREASRLGLSMEEFVRRLIREKRENAASREKPSTVFRRHFGPENGVELPARRTYNYVKLKLDENS